MTRQGANVAQPNDSRFVDFGRLAHFSRTTLAAKVTVGTLDISLRTWTDAIDIIGLRMFLPQNSRERTHASQA